MLVEGRVRFDPTRDAVERLELILNGTSLLSFPRKGVSPEISFQFHHEARESCWIAVRASGRKLDEPPEPARSFIRPTSMAHSAPIFVTLEGTLPFSAHPKTKALARGWLGRLEDLEKHLAEDQIQYLAKPAEVDGVDADYIHKNRPALLQAIQSAKKHFTHLAR